MSTSDNNLATIEHKGVVLDTQTQNTRKGDWLWKPGTSGNPSGRPKHDISAQICRAIVEKHGQALENALVRMCKKDVKAIKFVFERAYGKLPQPVEHAGANGGPIEIVFGVDAPPWLRNGEE